MISIQLTFYRESNEVSIKKSYFIFKITKKESSDEIDKFIIERNEFGSLDVTRYDYTLSLRYKDGKEVELALFPIVKDSDKLYGYKEVHKLRDLLVRQLELKNI